MEDLTGLKFHKLTAIRRQENQPFKKKIIWIWECECGEKIPLPVSSVKNGLNTDCGCEKGNNWFARKICPYCGELSSRIGSRGNFAVVCQSCHSKLLNKSYQKGPARRMWARTKARALRDEILFAIKPSDLSIPERCPILGILLDSNKTGRGDDSPSIDRLRPELGYVCGNVFVISDRANRIKNNGTAEEHRKIADWMDGFPLT